MPPQGINPGDQRIEFRGVDLVLQPGDLITQFAQVITRRLSTLPVSLQPAVKPNGLHETTGGPTRGPFGLVWVHWTKSYPGPRFAASYRVQSFPSNGLPALTKKISPD
jgi:hypothetical protein